MEKKDCDLRYICKVCCKDCNHRTGKYVNYCRELKIVVQSGFFCAKGEPLDNIELGGAKINELQA